jgi:hypothetical protein
MFLLFPGKGMFHHLPDLLLAGFRILAMLSVEIGSFHTGEIRRFPS